jgi:hypothetical protein
VNRESRRKGGGRERVSAKKGTRREQELQRGERKCKGKQNEQERTE